MTEKQLSRADLKGMTAEAIVEAKAEGRLNDLIGVPIEQTALITKAGTGERLSLADVRELYALGQHEAITDAAADGRIAGLAGDEE